MTTSILIVIDNYWLNRYAIEVMLRNCQESTVELLCVNNTDSGQPIDFLDEIIKLDSFKNVIKVGEINEGKIPYAKALNRLIKESKGDKICVFDADYIVCKNWLYDLKYYNDMIVRSGITAISEFPETKSYTSILNKNDEFINVWKSDDGSINSGAFIFNKGVIEEIGIFDERMSHTTFKKQFSIRAHASGFENYYIAGQTGILSNTKFDLTIDQKKELEIKNKEYEKMMQSSIMEMRKNKNFKIQA